MGAKPTAWTCCRDVTADQEDVVFFYRPFFTGVVLHLEVDKWWFAVFYKYVCWNVSHRNVFVLYIYIYIYIRMIRKILIHFPVLELLSTIPLKKWLRLGNMQKKALFKTNKELSIPVCFFAASSSIPNDWHTIFHIGKGGEILLRCCLLMKQNNIHHKIGRALFTIDQDTKGNVYNGKMVQCV